MAATEHSAHAGGASWEAVERVFRDEAGRITASLIRVFGGDFDLAEDMVQEALITALDRWPREGIPANPGAWITTTARRKAIDRLRRDQTFAEKQQLLAGLAELQSAGVEAHGLDHIPDDRLRLIFTCCHPALAPDAQVALTLRTLCGLTTPEIARAFLVPEATLAQRIVRAKQKIKAARIPYVIPAPEHLPERLEAVLAVIYLIFNEGYSAHSGDDLVRRDLCREALRLGRIVHALLPDSLEATGLLALMLLQSSRLETRIAADGSLILLEDQDRTRWDHAAITEGSALVDEALAGAGMRPGPYVIQAAIAALHAQAPSAAETDWHEVAWLYGALLRVNPSPVVELNRAVAVAMADGPAVGLTLLDRADLATALDDYHHYHVARADLLRRLGLAAQAAAAYERALALGPNPVERDHLEARLSALR